MATSDSDAPRSFSGMRPNPEMTMFGYLMAAILLIVVLPLLPILILAWVIWQLTGAGEE